MQKGFFRLSRHKSCSVWASRVHTHFHLVLNVLKCHASFTGSDSYAVSVKWFSTGSLDNCLASNMTPFETFSENKALHCRAIQRTFNGSPEVSKCHNNAPEHVSLLIMEIHK